jgi:ABC-type protease/lipase transport system fused ATPase/permease subunit
MDGARQFHATEGGSRGSAVIHRLDVLQALFRFEPVTDFKGRDHLRASSLRDLDQIRTFLTGPGPTAIVDLPWAPVFLAICFLIHPWLGLLAVAGALILLTLTLLTERNSRAPTQAMTQNAGLRAAAVELTRRNSETVVAMGMGRALTKRWQTLNDRYLAASTRASDVKLPEVSCAACVASASRNSSMTT